MTSVVNYVDEFIRIIQFYGFLPLYSADLDGFFPEAAAADSGVGQKLKQKGGASFIAELSCVFPHRTLAQPFFMFFLSRLNRMNERTRNGASDSNETTETTERRRSRALPALN